MATKRPAAAREHHPDDWLTRVEAADYAVRSVDTIDRAIKAGKLKATKTDGRVAIRRRWVDAYLLLVLEVVVALIIVAALQLLDFI